MVFDFFRPIDSDLINFFQDLPAQTLGRKTIFHTQTDFPKIELAKIAIIGVLENRGLDNGQEIDITLIRKQFYSLYAGNWSAQIVDLGDIVPGNEAEDTYYVLKNAVAYLIKNNVIPIVLGGSQDLTYAMYRAYDQLEQMVNVVSVDAKFDFENEKASKADAYLTKMIVEEPNNLFNYSNIGYQTYFNSQEEIDLIEKLYFEAYRLGEVCSNSTIAEPIFRDADLVSVDLLSIKSSDSGNFSKFVPNGFNGKEICVLSRYAGISDKTTSFGIFNYFNSENEAVLIAQIIWYFIEGYHYRSNEYPFGTKENYIKYIVTLEEELVFYKSNKTERWWIEIPYVAGQNNKLKKATLFPCTHEDYLSACNGEFPERWWKAQRKNIL
ncbi:formimidoylglutamase [Flavobacterium luminosum]|uniref:Formimidoylglutamase n=1 Tax=Flavobacterium luminosum TaxID=2949086 RepID=A0ABT0TKC9_9FLAO|nr:formimidoylglutamase [Flavobacterium sp. HXWNR70]MCL9807950.1 formimidoylglutamase [Flavobacterium sp. HXWNR70]